MRSSHFGFPSSWCLQVIVAQGGDKFYKHKGIAADGGVHMVIECVGGACFEVRALILRRHTCEPQATDPGIAVVHSVLICVGPSVRS